MRLYLIAVVGLAILASIAPAQPVDCDPNKDYSITPQAGPWLVCMTNFTGETGEQTARDLILEMRRRYKLPAYLFIRNREEKQKQREQIMKIHELVPDEYVPKTGRRIRGVRIEEQFAVLIGDYRDMESARKALDGLRKMEIGNHKDDKDMRKYMYVVEQEDKQQAAKLSNGTNVVDCSRALIDPFTTAFVIHNPTIPREVKKDDTNDPSLKSFNSEESYSLLKCRKPWTLAVKTFQGSSMMNAPNDNSFMHMIGLGGGPALSASGAQAHELARLLRDVYHFEAYVLHTRNNSVVAVGSFDSKDDPRIAQLQMTVSRVKLEGAGPAMQLFTQPMVMAVPRP